MASSTPPWMLGKISREEIELLCRESGMVHGTFGVRDYNNEDHALCVVFNGRVTHHRLQVGPDATFLVNKKSYGNFKTVIALVEHLQRPSVPGWPVQLKYPLMNSAVAAMEPSVSPAVPTSQITTDAQLWLYPAMGNREATDLLMGPEGKADGTFIVRKRVSSSEEQYVISVIYQGKATHHLVSKDSDGTLLVNKNRCEGCQRISEVVHLLRDKLPGVWPVALSNPIVKHTDKLTKETISSVTVDDEKPTPVGLQSQQDLPPVRTGQRTEADDTVEKDQESREVRVEYSKTQRQRASARLQDLPDNEAPHEHSRTTGAIVNVRPEEEQTLTISVENRTIPKPDGKVLSSSRNSHKTNTTPTVDGTTIQPNSGSNAAAAPYDIPSWIHMDMNRAESEELLRQVQAEEGDFLVRTKDNNTETYTLVVMYKGRVTHHEVKENAENASFTVNRSPCGNSKNIADVVSYFQKPVKGWPVVLKRGISAKEKTTEEPSLLQPNIQTAILEKSVSPKSEFVTVKTEAVPLTSVVGAETLPPTPPVTTTATHVLSRTTSRESLPKDRISEATQHADKIAQQLTQQAEDEEARITAERSQQLVAFNGTPSREHAQRLQKRQTEEFHGFDDSAAKLQDRELSFAEAVLAHVFTSYEENRVLVDRSVLKLASLTAVEFDPESPAYLWRACSKQQSAALFADKADGTYLLRRPRSSDKDHVLLDLVYNGKLTTHAVDKGPDGKYRLNQTPIGDYTTVDDLVFRLKSPLKNWPVILRHPCYDPSKCQPRVPGYGSGESDKNAPSYLWDSISRREIESMLAPEPDGTFLVRRKKDSDKAFLLSVQYNRKYTQHLISVSDTGVYLVNDKPMGGKATLDDVIEYLRAPHDNWPVRLTCAFRAPNKAAPMPLGPTNEESAQAMTENEQLVQKLLKSKRILSVARQRVECLAAGSVYAIDAELQSTVRAVDKVVALAHVAEAEVSLKAKEDALKELRHYERLGMPLPGTYVEVDPNNPSYLWSITAAECELKLQGLEDGAFLVRHRPQTPSWRKHFLAVVFHGKVTHHELSRSDTGVFVVNGKPMGGKSTIDGVVSFLRHTPRRGWPVVLTTPVRNPERTQPEAEAVRAAAADVAVAEIALQDARATLATVNPDKRTPSMRRKLPPGAAVPDPRQTVPEKLRVLLKARQDALHAHYETVTDTTLPMLGEDHTDALLQVMEVKLAEFLNLPQAHWQRRQQQLYRVLIEVKKVAAERQWFKQIDGILKGAANDSSDGVYVIHQMIGSLEGRITACHQQWASMKKQKGALAHGTSDGTRHANTIACSIDKISQEYSIQKQTVTELHGILTNPVVVQFFYTASAVTSAALSALLKGYQTRHQQWTCQGVTTSAGFIPLPPFADTVRSRVSIMFSRGACTDATSIHTVAMDTARLLAVRFHDQINRLQAFDAMRFAAWLPKPLVAMLVCPPKDPVKLTVTTAGLTALVMDARVAQNAPHIVQYVDPSTDIHKNGLRTGDTIVSVEGIRLETLSEEVIYSIVRESAGNTVVVEVQRDADLDVPTTHLDCFLVRLIEAYDDRFRLDVYDDDPDAMADAFNGAMDADLLGGNLYLHEYGVYCKPFELITKCGLVAVSEDDCEDTCQYHDANATDVGTFGFRRQVPSRENLYSNLQVEFRQLRWMEPVRINEAKSLGEQLSETVTSLQIDDGKKLEVLWNPVETIALQKTAEAEQLALKVKQLERHVAKLTNQNDQLRNELHHSQPTQNKFLNPSRRSGAHRKQQSLNFVSALHSSNA